MLHISAAYYSLFCSVFSETHNNTEEGNRDPGWTCLLSWEFTVATHQQVCVFQVLFPEGPDLPLSSNVPNVEFHSMRGNTLNVEALK